MKILAICPSDWHGVRRALRTYTDRIASPAEARVLIDTVQPQIVLFGCYMPEWESTLKYARERGCVCVLTWFASYILNEFNPLNRRWMCAALDAYKAGWFTHIATPHQGLATAWSLSGYPTSYLPLCVSAELPAGIPREGIHLGVFGSGQPWKNMECQLLAASLVPNATIHVQNPPDARSVITTMGIRYEAHPYITTDAEYYALIGSMTVNLCVSLSETYSYLTAESLLMGTPVLTSHITPILRNITHGHVLSVCKTAWFDDPMAIAYAIRNVIGERDHIRKAAPAYMQSYNKLESEYAKQLIERWSSDASRLDRLRP